MVKIGLSMLLKRPRKGRLDAPAISNDLWGHPATKGFFAKP
jgi:hypothetical protein